MKKIILISAVMFLSFLYVNLNAENRNTPVGNPQALSTADYGGGRLSTYNISSAAKLVFRGPGVIYGVVFSSGDTSGYVTLRDTNTANTSSEESYRLYNIGKATSTVGGVTSSGFSGTPYPVRFNNGASVNANVATFNNVGILYYQNPVDAK